jgi:6-pyruvoyltetrahydropterin/6-carboxytetrahydropterin synthase
VKKKNELFKSKIPEESMYKLNVISHFSSAHKLENYDGPCKHIHGHNWKVRIAILCHSTNEIGLTIDFGIVKKYLNEIMETLDHTFLNDLDCFKDINPTSEHIARYVFLSFQKILPDKEGKVTEVEVWESDKSSVVYFE